MILSDPIKKLPPNAKGQIRYRFVVDVGTHPATGKRKQLTRTFGTLRRRRPSMRVSRCGVTKGRWCHATR